jgi:hypothetical protein
MLGPLTSMQPCLVASTLLLAACLAACADTSATYTGLNAPPRAVTPRSPDQVEVFSSVPPERPHVDIGLITVQEGDGDETPASLIALLRGAAADKGCDAVLLAPPSSRTGALWFGGTRTYQVYSGTCLVYGSAPPRPEAPPQPSRPRMCRDRTDFDEHRNCILPAPKP